MSFALSSPSPRAARAHDLKNCLAVVAVNRLFESDCSGRLRERLAQSQNAVDRVLAIIHFRTGGGPGTVVSTRLPAPAPDSFAEERCRAASGS